MNLTTAVKPTTITAGGRHYTLSPPTINSMIKAEALLGTPQREMTWGQIITDSIQLKASAVSAVIFAALQTHHADEITTLDDAGRFIDAAGGMFVLSDMLRKAAAARAAPPPRSDAMRATRTRTPRRRKARG